MSEKWFNVRFGKRHFKIGGDRWWHIEITENPYYDKSWPLVNVCLIVIFGKRIF